jgi:hypothetical protein
METTKVPNLGTEQRGWIECAALPHIQCVQRGWHFLYMRASCPDSGTVSAEDPLKCFDQTLHNRIARSYLGIRVGALGQ